MVVGEEPEFEHQAPPAPLVRYISKNEMRYQAALFTIFRRKKAPIFLSGLSNSGR